MKKIKKVWSIILVLTLMMGLVTASASAVCASEGSNEIVDASTGKWVSAWSTSPLSASLKGLDFVDKLGVPVAHVTNRVVVESTASGNAVRLTFSNEYGNTPLIISECNVATADNDNHRKVDKNTRKSISFSGKKYGIIPAGETLVSDPIVFDIKAGDEVAVTTYYRSINVMRTIGLIGGDSYVAFGNKTKSNNLFASINLKFEANSGTYEIIPALMSVEVLAAKDTDVCVIFGDSTVSNNVPRLLAKKLRENGLNNISVTQQAIKGNRLIADGTGVISNILGEAGVERFERDVINQSGVKYVIVKLGINDIVHPYCASKADKLTPVSFEEMVEGYNKLIKMAHDNGIKIYISEITPWKGYTRNLFGRGDDVNWTEEIDKVRLQLNNWFASDDCKCDGYISLSAMHNLNDNYALIPEETTDGIHHNIFGQENMVSQFSIELFK